MQRSFDDLGVPLCDVTFCVIDIETTGASAATCEITEVGAVKVRGGECLGTFQTLVNPGVAIPPYITYLTGITEAMVLPAPTIAEVLPSLVEFVGDAVLVGHNVRFDLGFLRAAMIRDNYPPWSNSSVDTCALARRLVRSEVPNLRLETLSRRFRLPHRPSHRALDDALATTDLLHVLLERAGTLGVLGLGDLLELPTMRGHPQAAKLRLTTRLPRAPGVYMFRDSGGRVLYVGKATDLRSRVRSYFSGDGRRKVDGLLRELAAIDHIVCANPLQAAVLEVRLIHRHLPRFNRQSKSWRRYAYLKLTLDERFPRLSVVRAVRHGDGCVYLGPLPSTASAREVADAVQSAVPIRRCNRRPPREPTGSPCAAAQLGVAACPCSGSIDERTYRSIVETVAEGLTRDASVLLEPLRQRMDAMAAAERFEEAAAARDRAAVLSRALWRQQRMERLRRSGRMIVDVPGEGGAVLVDGQLIDAWPDGARPITTETMRIDRWAEGVSCDIADELLCVASWLDDRAAELRLLSCDGDLTTPLPRLPSFRPEGERPRV